MSGPSRSSAPPRRRAAILRSTLSIVAFLLGLSRTGPEILARLPPAAAAALDWPAVDGHGGRHSAPAGSITTSNVSELELAWSYRTGAVATHASGVSGTAFEAAPLMMDRTLFVPTPRGRVAALDAETGAERWTFDPRTASAPSTSPAAKRCGRWSSRRRRRPRPSPTGSGPAGGSTWCWPPADTTGVPPIRWTPPD